MEKTRPYRTCQSTGYHSYMSHNNNAFCRPCLTLSCFMAPKNDYDPMEYMLKRADIATACVKLSDFVRHSSGTMPSLRVTCVKNSSLADCYYII